MKNLSIPLRKFFGINKGEPVELIDSLPKVKIITDEIEYQPIQPDSEFNFEQYSDAIYNLVRSSEPKFSIGIYGEWGTGKTTLMRLIEKKLKGYIFSWESDLSDKSSAGLKEYLKSNFNDLDWIDNKQFQKSLIGNAITISDGKNSLSIELNTKNMKAVAKLNGQRFHDLIAVRENDKIDIHKREILTVWFNAWRYEREEYFALVALMKTIAYAMGDHPYYKEAKPIILNGLKILGKDLLRQVASQYITEKGIEEFEKKLLPKTELLDEVDKGTIYFDGINKIEAIMNDITQKYLMDNGRIVVFVDDLDRCTDDKALEVFESIKVFLDIKGFIFIIGLSHDAIIRLIEAKYRKIGLGGVKGEEYIRKILQIDVNIPRWKDYAIIHLIDHLLLKLNKEEAKKVFAIEDLIAFAVENNPRQTKRFINRFLTILTANPSLDAKKFMVLEVIKKRWPSFYQQITNAPFTNEVKKYVELPEEQRRETLSFRENDKKRPLNDTEKILIKLDDEFWKFLVDHKDSILPVSPEEHQKYIVASQSTESPLEEENIVQQTSIKAHKTWAKPSLFRGEKPNFIDRQQYISLIRKFIEESNYPISIVGPPGIGKSALAHKAIHECDDMFDLIIPLYFEYNSTFNSFLSSVASGMNISLAEFDKVEVGTQGQFLMNQLERNFVHPLLFVDNYEIISGDLTGKSSRDDAVQISNFLNNVPPNTSIILTSRERINLEGERLIELNGLSPDEGMELFVRLAQDDKLKNNPKSSEIIRNIVKQTGGHPLSVQILARSYSGLGLDEIEDMSRGLISEATDSRAQDQRLRSLRDAFDYSVNKLDTDLKELLKKLTFFRSPFLVSAAVEIFDAGKRDILNLLNRSLLNKIELEQGSRYDEGADLSMYSFHPATRNYLDHYLVTDEMNNNIWLQYGKSFSRYYVKLLGDISDAVGNETQPFYMKLFEIISEPEKNDFERCLILTEDIRLQSSILNQLGYIYHVLGFLSKALYFYQEGNSLNISLGDKKDIASSHINLSLILKDMGRYDEALENNKKAIAIDEELQDKVGMANDYSNMSLVLKKMSRFDEAIENSKKALQIHEELQDKVGIANDYSNMSLILMEMGRYDEALEHNKKAIVIDEELQDKVGMANDYNTMTSILTITGRHNEALEYNKKAIAIDEELQDKVGMANDYDNLASILTITGRHNEALEYNKKALEIREELQDKVGMANDYTNISVTLKDMGKYDDAIEYSNKALQIREELQDKVGMANDYDNLASILIITGRHNEALEYNKKASQIRGGQ